MPRPIIGRRHTLTYGVPDGCGTCGRDLFEGTTVAFVNEQLTCLECVEKLIGESAIGRKARMGGLRRERYDH